jgi:hypothetical protein
MSNEIQTINADEHSFAMAQRQAKALAASDLVPAQFRNNVPNVLIAMDMAHRLGASPMMVMQNLYIVHGNPGWSAQFLIATLNKSGKFTPLRFDVRGDDPHASDYRVRAIATDRESGELCEGPWVTWRLVDGEGWKAKKGSKWQTMPDMMFRYRAAAFFVRLYSPETAMGIHTADEVEDYVGASPKASLNASLAATMASQDGASDSKDVVDVVAEPVKPAPALALAPDLEVELDDVVDAIVGDEPAIDDSMSTVDAFTVAAAALGMEFDALLYECCSALAIKATTVSRFSKDDEARAVRWCREQMEAKR